MTLDQLLETLKKCVTIELAPVEDRNERVVIVKFCGHEVLREAFDIRHRP